MIRLLPIVRFLPQVLFVLSTAAGHAEPVVERKLDIATFTGPAGWTVAERAGVVTFLDVDAKREIYCLLAVHDSKPGTGDAQKDFAREWKEVVQKSLTSEGVPESKAVSGDQGLRYREGGMKVSVGGKPSYARLLTIEAGPRVMSVMILTSNEASLESYRQPVTAFLKSIRLVVKDEGKFRGGGIAGVWMGLSLLEPTEYRWVTLFDDGQVYQDLPLSGLMGFDRSANKADKHQKVYWGTYTFRDGSGQIDKPGVIDPTRITAVKAGEIRLDTAPYYHCADVDGLRLDGAWTTLADPNDPAFARMAAGRRTIFRFRKDGSFTDEGVFAGFGGRLGGDPDTSDDDVKSGSGTYEVKDFTLVLNYSDGRVKKLGITGHFGADPATSDKSLFLSRTRFTKMNR